MVRNKESEADRFARDYLFSEEKLNYISRYFHNPDYVRDYTLNNHVHPSFPYVFYAYLKGSDKYAWARAQK